MAFFKYIINAIEYVAFIYFAIATIYILIFAIASRFSSKDKRLEASRKRRMAVFIPGYKEDSVIVDVAEKALHQTYGSNHYDVVVIADSFKPETISGLQKLPIKLIEVSFEKSTKSKSLNQAMAQLDDSYEIAFILDADNIMADDVLERINEAFERGFRVVQGHRIAKNLNTSFALLDAVSEEVNNRIFRKGHRNLGLSSALIGSGMAFDYSLFKEIMSNVKAVGGFDKELELELLKAGIKIEYLNDALILDEKVQKADAFANQRKRWLSAQFVYFRRYFFSGLKHLLLRGNIDYFDKVYQMISPPRVLLLGLVTILTIGYGIIDLSPGMADFFVFCFSQWLNMTLMVYLAFIFAIPSHFYNRKTFLALLELPKAFLLMLFSLFRLKGANKRFIHTEHGVSE